MMGRQVEVAQLFYEFSLERHVPTGHLLRRIDEVLDLSWLRAELAPFYSNKGRLSIDPELMVVGQFETRRLRGVADGTIGRLRGLAFCRFRGEQVRVALPAARTPPG